jgi:hypothetical protein
MSSRTLLPWAGKSGSAHTSSSSSSEGESSEDEPVTISQPSIAVAKHAAKITFRKKRAAIDYSSRMASDKTPDTAEAKHAESSAESKQSSYLDDRAGQMKKDNAYCKDKGAAKARCSDTASNVGKICQDGQNLGRCQELITALLQAIEIDLLKVYHTGRENTDMHSRATVRSACCRPVLPLGLQLYHFSAASDDCSRCTCRWVLLSDRAIFAYSACFLEDPHT